MLLPYYHKTHKTKQKNSPFQPIKPSAHILIAYNNLPLSKSTPFGPLLPSLIDHVTPPSSSSVEEVTERVSEALGRIDEPTLIVQYARDGLDQSVDAYEIMKEGAVVGWCRLPGGHMEALRAGDGLVEVVRDFVERVERGEFGTREGPAAGDHKPAPAGVGRTVEDDDEGRRRRRRRQRPGG
eukprot:CAMPEP_0182457822 /NCGR_PEP_ID=MMETSP1319-20130603/3301_1 /TAXON_ID=172717 /ORGANISM="Bolidomonas pacifica, Strain RCC208" /LENGTH=181 /DNA_ID=CAMNT_0024656365 /DNA_START=542 /DNA_END=1087 /DNA_ORIENTATION=-